MKRRNLLQLLAAIPAAMGLAKVAKAEKPKNPWFSPEVKAGPTTVTLADLDELMAKMCRNHPGPQQEYDWRVVCTKCRKTFYATHPPDACPVCGTKAHPPSELEGLRFWMTPPKENP